jgi:hypothetical protein
VILYHFTSRYHLGLIEREGGILPTESNIGSPVSHLLPYGDHVGPDVVWLLDTPDPFEYGHGLADMEGEIKLAHDKREVRITVDVAPIKWSEWEPAMQMNRKWRERFIASGGGPEAAEHWYVFPAPIRRRLWLSVEPVIPAKAAT